MASSSASHQSFTDCTHCKSLCLGPTILPCGHIICRKCLRQILEGPDPTCPSCGHSIPREPGQTVSEVADNLSKDLILEELVNEHLAQKGDFRCITCPSRLAEKVCLDCGDTFCDACSWAHCDDKQHDVHVLQDLPQTLDSSRTTTPANSRPGSLNPRRAARDLKETLKNETGLLKAKVTQVKRAVRTVNDVIADLQEVKEGLHQKEELLTTYTIGLSTVPDARAIFPRLERVREDCAPPPSAALKELKRRAKTLAADQYIGGGDQTWPSIILSGQSRFDPARRTSEWSVVSHATAQMDFSSEESAASDSEEFSAPDMAELSGVPFPQHHVEVVIRKERTQDEGEKEPELPGEVRSEGVSKTERLVAIPHSTTINMPDVGLVGVQEILDTAIQHAVENVLIAKIDWGNNAGSFILPDEQGKRWSGHLTVEAKPEHQEDVDGLHPVTMETDSVDAVVNGMKEEVEVSVEEEGDVQERGEERRKEEREGEQKDMDNMEAVQSGLELNKTPDTASQQTNGETNFDRNELEEISLKTEEAAQVQEETSHAKESLQVENQSIETSPENADVAEDENDVEIEQDMNRVQIRLKGVHAELKAVHQRKEDERNQETAPESTESLQTHQEPDNKTADTTADAENNPQTEESQIKEESKDQVDGTNEEITGEKSSPAENVTESENIPTDGVAKVDNIPTDDVEKVQNVPTDVATEAKNIPGDDDTEVQNISAEAIPGVNNSITEGDVILVERPQEVNHIPTDDKNIPAEETTGIKTIPSENETTSVDGNTNGEIVSAEEQQVVQEHEEKELTEAREKTDHEKEAESKPETTEHNQNKEPAWEDIVDHGKGEIREEKQELDQANHDKESTELPKIHEKDEDKHQHKHDSTISFILRPERKNPQLVGEVIKQMGEGVLPRVVERLFEEFHVRLLGVDCGLNFLMETPMAQWATVVERQEDVQKILCELFPHDVVGNWAEVKQCGQSFKGTSTRLGQPLPVQLIPRNGPVQDGEALESITQWDQFPHGKPSQAEDEGPIAVSTLKRGTTQQTATQPSTQQGEITSEREGTATETAPIAEIHSPSTVSTKEALMVHDSQNPKQSLTEKISREEDPSMKPGESSEVCNVSDKLAGKSEDTSTTQETNASPPEADKTETTTSSVQAPRTDAQAAALEGTGTEHTTQPDENKHSQVNSTLAGNVETTSQKQPNITEAEYDAEVALPEVTQTRENFSSSPTESHIEEKAKRDEPTTAEMRSEDDVDQMNIEILNQDSTDGGSTGTEEKQNQETSTEEKATEQKTEHAREMISQEEASDVSTHEDKTCSLDDVTSEEKTGEKSYSTEQNQQETMQQEDETAQTGGETMHDKGETRQVEEETRTTEPETAQDQQETTQEAEGSTSTDHVTTPKTEKTTPKEQETAQKEQETAQKEQETSSEEQRTTLTEERIPFGEQVTALEEQETAPKEQETAPKEQETAPEEQETAPEEQETAPKEQETAPKEQETAPKEQETAPKEQETALNEQENPLEEQQNILQEHERQETTAHDEPDTTGSKDRETQKGGETTQTDQGNEEEMGETKQEKSDSTQDQEESMQTTEPSIQDQEDTDQRQQSTEARKPSLPDYNYPDTDTDSEDGTTPTEYTFVDEHDSLSRSFDRHLLPGERFQPPAKENSNHEIQTIFHRQFQDEATTVTDASNRPDESIHREKAAPAENGFAVSVLEMVNRAEARSSTPKPESIIFTDNLQIELAMPALDADKQTVPETETPARTKEKETERDVTTAKDQHPVRASANHNDTRNTGSDRLDGKLENGRYQWNGSEEKPTEEEVLVKPSSLKAAQKKRTSQEIVYDSSEFKNKLRDIRQGDAKPKEVRPWQINRNEASRNGLQRNGSSTEETSPKMMSRREVVQAVNAPKMLPFPHERNTPREISVKSSSQPKKERHLLHHFKTSKERVQFNPMTSTPRRTFLTRPDGDDDTHKDGPGIMAVVCAKDGRLVLTDFRNKTVKVSDRTNPAKLYSVKLDAKPLTLATLNNDTVAVTTLSKFIYRIDVSDSPAVLSKVPTLRKYWGVAPVSVDDTLVASCCKDKDGPASVDILSRGGVVIKTVIDSNTLPELAVPNYLCVQSGDVLITDCQANVVFRVDLATGWVVERLKHPDLTMPHQVATDANGFVYIASNKRKCVLVTSRGGEWRRLLVGVEHGDGGRVYPVGVCVTHTGVVVTWNEEGGYSVVAGYDMK